MTGARRSSRLRLLTVLCFIIAASPALMASPGAAPSTPDKSSFIVHEWGTFLSVQGSDGVTLGGMVDNDEVLPAFVESRSIANWNRSMGIGQAVALLDRTKTMVWSAAVSPAARI